MDYAGFLAVYFKYISENGEYQRQGQMAFNALHMYAPDIANRIRTTDADPFYNDDRIPAFFDAVSHYLPI